jgi:hypothetical protein
MISVIALLAALVLFKVVEAQDVWDDWLFPRCPNLSQMLLLGEAIIVSWNSSLGQASVFSESTFPNSDVELWITDWATSFNFSHKIGSSSIANLTTNLDTES